MPRHASYASDPVSPRIKKALIGCSAPTAGVPKPIHARTSMTKLSLRPPRRPSAGRAVAYEELNLSDDAAAEADGHRMRARSRLQLGEQVAHVRLHRLLRQEEPGADLAVHEAVRDQLQNLDLPHRRLLLELAEGAAERNHLGVAVLTPGRGRVEAALMAM